MIWVLVFLKTDIIKPECAGDEEDSQALFKLRKKIEWRNPKGFHNFMTLILMYWFAPPCDGKRKRQSRN